MLRSEQCRMGRQGYGIPALGIIRQVCELTLSKWACGFVLLMAVSYSLLGVAPAALATPTDVGYRDFSFGTGLGAPTGEKPQSKLWFNDGIWWGALWDRGTFDFHIFRFDWASQSWSDTGTLVERRSNSKPDVLWDGSHLYVASAPSDTSSSDQNAYVRRFSYDGATQKYTLDANFPATVASGAMETITLDKDTTGKVWVTYTQGSQVYVNSSLSSDSSWGTPFVLPVNGTSVSADDISAVVAFDSQTAAPQIGVMWSNQINDAIYFSTHRDGDPDNVWQQSRTAIAGPKSSDDHINLKALQSDSSGRVFAAVKTSLGDLQNANPNAPLNQLLVLGQDGQWTSYTFGRVADGHTRPIILIDEQHRALYMFATSPETGGAIYYKRTSLDNIYFQDGLGTPFIKSSTDTNINNATSTKQNLNNTTGLLVLASDNTSDFYLHNTIDLASVDATPPETTIDSGPSGITNSASASFPFTSSEPNSAFQCKLDGGAYESCSSPKDYSNLSEGSHTFEVRAIDAAGNTDPTPANRTWTVDTVAPTAGGVMPTDGATGVSLSTNVEATFSEDMDTSTINGSTFTLAKRNADSTTTAVAAAVTYDSAARKAVLDPSADLAAGVTYTATIKGGTGGVKDLVGNPLAADKTWSFTTTAAALAAPSNLSAVQSGSLNKQLIDLSWADNSSSEANFVIERSTTSGFTTNLVTYKVSANTTTYRDNTALKRKTTYYYRVFAVDASGARSAPSNVASATTK